MKLSQVVEPQVFQAFVEQELLWRRFVGLKDTVAFETAVVDE